ncbi:hypothetical protein HPB49_020411 [Dermacentor silvarum]|uniref:Uncharacterized protein n=1 Tax=Dermacentor silvarum TaxID=543639 RepID=A0ACB8CMN2_DERSI|nr:hypothetical protein HPB49_020411 [Dermacentor silvarum]
MLAVCGSLKHLDLSENRIDRGRRCCTELFTRHRAFEWCPGLWRHRCRCPRQQCRLGDYLSPLRFKDLNSKGMPINHHHHRALRCADSIKIKLGRIKVSDQASTELCKLFIKNLSAWQRIDVFWDIQSVADFANVLKQCGGLEEFTVPAFGRPQKLLEGSANLPRLEAAVEHLIETLTLTDNVRVLRVMNTGHVGNAEVLSNYLVRTRTLRKLKFMYGSLRGWNIPVFMEALSMNKSLVELDFGDADEKFL